MEGEGLRPDGGRLAVLDLGEKEKASQRFDDVQDSPGDRPFADDAHSRSLRLASKLDGNEL